MSLGMIICGYPCIGKTTLGSIGGHFNLDLESSMWSHDDLEPLDPNIWVPRYCESAISLAHQGFNVMTSTHPEVITCFEKKLGVAKLPIVIFAPRPEWKEAWIEKAKNRYEDDHSAKNRRAYEHILEHYNDDILALEQSSLPCFHPDDLDYSLKECIRKIEKETV